MALLLAFASSSALLCQKADAHQLFLGAGGSFQQISLPTGTSAGSALYYGPGVQGELRFRLLPGVLSADFFGLDLFGSYGTQFAQNSSSGSNESNRRTGYGGGLDFRLGQVFLGVGYMQNVAGIAQGSSNVQLRYATYGGRLGINLVSISHRSPVNVAVGGEFQIGSITVNGVSGTVNQLAGFIAVGFDLFSFISSGI